jgi:YspA, cpYpsA-related SLOG family
MRVIVCGGRDYPPSMPEMDQLLRSLGPLGELVVVHGDCPTGVDAAASHWCAGNCVRQEKHPADWKQHGRSAGPLRNIEMAESGADLCLAWPGGTGTASMVSHARNCGIPVRFVVEGAQEDRT